MNRATTRCSATIGVATARSRPRMRTFRDVIDEKAAFSPSLPFLLAPEIEATLTYGELRRRARSFAADLQAIGAQPGAIVGFMLPNGIAAASIFLSAMYAGYIVMPINLLAQDSHVDHVLRHASPAIVYVTPELQARLKAAVERSGAQTDVKAVFIDDRGDFQAQCAALPPIEPSSPAMPIYTSGTTRAPKAALPSPANRV